MSCSCAERASSLTRPLALLPLRFPSAHRQLTTLAVSLIPLFFLAHPRPSYCYRLHLTVQSTSPSLLPCLPPRLRHGARGTGKGSLTTGVATLYVSTTLHIIFVLLSKLIVLRRIRSYVFVHRAVVIRSYHHIVYPIFVLALIVSKVVAGQ